MTPRFPTPRDYIQHVVLERNWAPGLRDPLGPRRPDRRSALCEAESATFVPDDPYYYGPYSISVPVPRR